jgi:hypothetical protein
LALAVAIGETLGRPAVVLALPDVKFSKADHPWDEKERLVRFLEGRYGMLISRKGGMRPAVLPGGLVDERESSSYLNRHRPCTDSRGFEQAKLTLRTKEGEALSLEQIASLGLDKALTWDRYLSRARFRVDVRSIGREDFLEAVAHAAGAVLESGERYHIRIDPSAYRAGAVRYWNDSARRAEQARDALAVAEAQYMAALLTSSSDDLLRSAYGQPEKRWGRTWLPGSNVHRLAWQRARLLPPTLGTSSLELFHRVADPSAPIWGYVEDAGVPRIGYLNRAQTEVITL